MNFYDLRDVIEKKRKLIGAVTAGGDAARRPYGQYSEWGYFRVGPSRSKFMLRVNIPSLGSESAFSLGPGGGHCPAGRPAGVCQGPADRRDSPAPIMIVTPSQGLID